MRGIRLIGHVRPGLPASVRGKIIAGFGLLMLILAVVVVGSAWLARNHQSDLAAMQQRTNIADLLQETQISAGTSAAFLYSYLTTDNELLVPTIRTSLFQSNQSLSEAIVEAEPQGQAEAQDLYELEATAASLSEGTQTMIALGLSGQTEEALDLLSDAAAPYRVWILQLEEAISYQQEQVAALQSRADRTGELAFWLLVVSGALGGTVALVASVLIARSILKPLSALESTARAVARGSSDARAPAGGPTELSHLGQTLNTMLTTVELRTQELRSANEDLQQRNSELRDARIQAATDGLTGIANHRAFHLTIADQITRAREFDLPLGLVMLDIDGFKDINDSHGHLAGDEILRIVAAILADTVGGEKTYRYGGDEFAVLLPDADRREVARAAEKLRRAVAKGTEGNSSPITVSLGIASFPGPAESAEELVYGADAAMYWAKAAGKNRFGDWNDLVRHREAGSLPWYGADRGVKAPDAVAALVAALAAKDPMTGAHTERCSWYSALLAKELGLGEMERSIVRLASLLHDIGKLGTRDEVLFKPGPLNEEEWAQMRRHPSLALDILSHIHSIADAIPAILHHHEHFDGSGYPDSLAGDDIPLASRILLVTDAFDAMTTDRPYRKAMPVEAAIEELKRNSGNQFDPNVVEAFLNTLSRHGVYPLHRTATAVKETA